MYLKDVSVFTWFLFNRLLYSINIIHIQSSQLQNSILLKYDIFRVKIYIFIKFKEIKHYTNISYFSDIVRYVATLAQLWLYCKVSGQFTFILSFLLYKLYETNDQIFDWIGQQCYFPSKQRKYSTNKVI